MDASPVTHIPASQNSSLAAPLQLFFFGAYVSVCNSSMLAAECRSLPCGSGRPGLLLITTCNERGDSDAETQGIFRS